MHVDELDVPVELVARLLAEQFPQWAGLPLERFASGGTVNAIFRLGDRLAVRLPLREQWDGPVAEDERVLPLLRAHLPVELPVPEARGEPAHGYPCAWGVYRWLDGDVVTPERVVDAHAFGTDLARFLHALGRVDAAPAPRPTSRGIPLRTRDTSVRAALAQLEGEIDVAVAAAAWDDALRAPDWDGAPSWIHGDLMRGNVLVDAHGRLAAVLDWSCACGGDPAGDAMAAWTLLPASARRAFRDAAGFDDATSARGRGWALSCALIVLPCYAETNPFMTVNARRALAEVLSDF